MPVTTVDNWEYARWVYIIGRSLRLNPPASPSAERTAAETFITNEVAKRSWLTQRTWEKGNNIGGENNNEYIGEMIAVIGRDLMKTPLFDVTEKGYCDTLFSATGDRKYGDKGGPAGSDVDIV